MTVRATTLTTLVALLGAPVVWTLHLFAAYFVVALFCNTGWPGASVVIGVITAALAVAAVAIGVLALSAWRRMHRRLSWEQAIAEEGSYTGMLLLVGFMLSILFVPLIVLNGVAPIFVPVCAP